MIFQHMTCSLDGAPMGFLHVHNACRLKKGNKATWFDCHRRFLPIDHPFRDDVSAFRKGKVVREGPPRSLTGVEVKDQLFRRVNDKKYGKEHNWAYVIGLWQLPYFEKLLLRRNIDMMHNEKIWLKLFGTHILILKVRLKIM
jgi:hypothetical protein